ncbi:MAG: metallophosphoesterase family protein [Polyangiaceae bacterium]
MRRTFVVGDIHGDIQALKALFRKFPRMTAEDTVVFIGDYVDRGPCSRQVVEFVRMLPTKTKAKVVWLRGNHEDAWLQVKTRGWPEFIVPRGNGCLETYRSFKGLSVPHEEETPANQELVEMFAASFFPDDVIEWMKQLPLYYEDEHAIYVHAGLPRIGTKEADRGFAHPSVAEPSSALLWIRDKDFFANYRGKLVVFGHTTTEQLPPELSSYTPEDPTDLWAGPAVVGLDTGAGKGGFLTGLELPARLVYESRPSPNPTATP